MPSYSTLAIPQETKLFGMVEVAVLKNSPQRIVSKVLPILLRVTTSCFTSCTNRTIFLVAKYFEVNLTHVKTLTIHGNTENRLQEDKDQPSRKNAPGQVPVHVRSNHGFSRPHFAASGHRLSLVHYLVGHDVGMSMPGLRWSVWSGLWASFACVMLDVIFCDFVCVLFVFSSYSGLLLLKT